jgi:hypothetical protein
VKMEIELSNKEIQELVENEIIKRAVNAYCDKGLFGGHYETNKIIQTQLQKILESDSELGKEIIELLKAKLKDENIIKEVAVDYMKEKLNSDY